MLMKFQNDCIISFPAGGFMASGRLGASSRGPVSMDAVVDWSRVVDKYLVMQGLSDGSKDDDRDSGFSEKMDGDEADDSGGMEKDIGSGV